MSHEHHRMHHHFHDCAQGRSVIDVGLVAIAAFMSAAQPNAPRPRGFGA